MVNEEKLWSQKTRERARRSTETVPEVTGAENGSMFKLQECESDMKQRKYICIYNVKNVKQRKSVRSQRDADH